MPNKRRVLFVTVGTTALSACNLGDLGSDGLGLRAQCRAVLDGATPSPSLRTRVLAAHEDLWKHPTLSRFDNRHHTSAEMASSYLFLHLQQPAQGKDLFDPALDRIVLLASDTPQGKLCAIVNDTLARRYLFSRHATERDAVIVEAIPGLDVKEGSFGHDIAACLERIWNENQASEETIVNITGGFKAMVPYLTWRCCQEKSAGHNCYLLYAHESMDRVEVVEFDGDSLKQKQLAMR